MKPFIRIVLALLFSLVVASCTTYKVPKEYIPDEKVVYLTQNTSLEPIIYPTEVADPYTFASDTAPVNAKDPAFLTNTTWNDLLKADFKADSRLYREVEAHFGYILNLPAIKDLKATLDAAVIEVTPPLAPEKGSKIKDYTNGAVFQYPPAANAQITILDGGYYEIAFGDKSVFRYQPDGTYERLTAAGQVVFASYPKQHQIVTSKDGLTFTLSANFRKVSGVSGTLVYLGQPEPQYQYSTSSDAAAPRYTFFVDDQNVTRSLSVTLKNGLRFDYFPKQVSGQQVGVLISNKDQAVFIDEKFEKTHERMDEKTHATTDVLSVFLPEGIRLTNFVASDPAYGQVNPAWPEGYKLKADGPFDVYYLPKDEALVQRISADRLSALANSDSKLTGLSSAQRRALIIPPDLATYRKLLVNKPGEQINWYPSGFATKDIIVMWPVSVPRYTSERGQDYFFNQEFYEIITHEYVHVLVGENTGLLNPVPVWLNEGLAVWVEAGFSPEIKAYWDLTFRVSQGLNRLLDWDLVTTTSTGSLEIAKARVHYAQSYALVSVLMEKFGAAKVAEYIKSFRASALSDRKADIKINYRSKFKQVFGEDFSEALKLLVPVSP